MLLAAACGDDAGETADPEPTAAIDEPVEAEVAPTEEPVEAEVAPTDEPVEAEVAPTEEPVEALRILLTNDDGVMAEGIDLVATALGALADVEVTIVAPAENQSGTADSLSEGAVEAVETTTLSGIPAIAVTGTPGDSVLHGLTTVLDRPPHLIVSGSNDAQNIGPLALISGTVGATRIGAREGIPGLAVSVGGLVVDPEFDPVIPLVVEWVEDHRTELVARPTGGVGQVFSINSPSCAGTGDFNGMLEVPLADEFGDYNGVVIDCALDIAEPANDVEAFVSGWASLTEIPEEIVLGTPG